MREFYEYRRSCRKEGRCKILAKNISLNGYENIIIENKAIMQKNIKPKFFNHTEDIAGLRYIKNENEHYDYLDTYKFQKPVEVTTIDLDGYLIKHGEYKSHILTKLNDEIFIISVTFDKFVFILFQVINVILLQTNFLGG